MEEETLVRASCCTSARAREAPREARRWAVARPMPDAAPVMAMTLPLKEAIVRYNDQRREGDARDSRDSVRLH